MNEVVPRTKPVVIGNSDVYENTERTLSCIHIPNYDKEWEKKMPNENDFIGIGINDTVITQYFTDSMNGVQYRLHYYNLGGNLYSETLTVPVLKSNCTIL